MILLGIITLISLKIKLDEMLTCIMYMITLEEITRSFNSLSNSKYNKYCELMKFIQFTVNHCHLLVIRNSRD